METTVEEATSVMETFDKDKNGLTKQEFASFLVNFAKTAKTNLVDMLNFMLVTAALLENTEAENEFMKDIGGGSRFDYWYGKYG